MLARVDHVSLHADAQRNAAAGARSSSPTAAAKLALAFFHRSTRAEYGFSRLKPGLMGMFAGTVSSFRGRLQLVHPEFELLPGARPTPTSPRPPSSPPS